MSIDSIIMDLEFATVLLTVFALGASADRLKRWLFKPRNQKRPAIKPSPARQWAVARQDWQAHGRN